MKSDIEALLNMRLAKLVLPLHLLAMYDARTAPSNRKMMANWCAWVAVLNGAIGCLDPFVVPHAAVSAFIVIRVLISLSFGLSSVAIRAHRLAGGEQILVVIPCMILMVLSGTAGIITQRNDLLIVYLAHGFIVAYAAVMCLRLGLRNALPLSRLSLAVMGIFLLGSGGANGAEKLQIFAFCGGTMIAAEQTRKFQNLYHQRIFLMQLRSEISTSESSAINRQLCDIAYTDQLTGLPNRRYFEEICASMNDETKYLFPLSLCMADIDHFKTLNDNLGHLQGDRCLRLVATAIRENLRGTRDILARYGGEEFVIVLPGASGEEAREVVERIRAAIEALAHPNPGAPLGIVTASFGVAAIDTPPLSIQALMSEADTALYRAKSAGRNQVAG